MSKTVASTVPLLLARAVESCDRVASAAPFTASRLWLSSLSCSGDSSASAATASVTALVASNANNKRVRRFTEGSPVPEPVAGDADREDQLRVVGLDPELLAEVS